MPLSKQPRQITSTSVDLCGRCFGRPVCSWKLGHFEAIFYIGSGKRDALNGVIARHVSRFMKKPAEHPPTPQRRILHIDMDAFFASVEQRDDPALRGKPVAVGSSKARGVVAAASYEARRFECALGATATGIAEDIRARIKQEVQLTASAGVSVNKFLAKLASDQNKPDGLTVIRPHQIADFVASLPVGRFHGVGPVTEAKMTSLGIQTGADLRAWSVADLASHFGSSAEHYWQISRGIDSRPVEPRRERKSVGAEETFEIDIVDLATARAALAPIALKVAARARQKGVLGHTVTVKVKFSDFRQITRQVTLRDPIHEAADIATVAGQLLTEVFPCRPVRLLGVSLSSLVPEDAETIMAQLSLFDWLSECGTRLRTDDALFNSK